MRNLRNIAWAGVVWLTACATVVAATPQWHCCCGDGRNAAACCLAAASAPAASAPAACCCRHVKPANPAKATCSCCQAKPSTAKSTSKCHSQCTRCLRVAAPQACFPVERPEPQDANPTSTAWTSVAAAQPQVSAGEFSLQTELVRHALPPPLDRVIVYEHFTI